MTISLLLMGLVSKAIVSASRYYTRLLQITELESTALTTLEHLHRELSESKMQKIVCETDNLIFPSPRDQDGEITMMASTSNLAWGTLICYQREAATGRLVRKYELSTPTAIPLDPLAQVPRRNGAYFVSHGQLSRVVANGVEAFRARFMQRDGPDPDDKPDSTSRKRAEFIQLTLELQVQKRKTIGIKMTMNATVRN